MCYYQPWEEDDLPQVEDNVARTVNNNDLIAAWEARLEILEERVARIEAQVEGLRARMLILKRASGVTFALFIVTLAYAISK